MVRVVANSIPNLQLLSDCRWKKSCKPVQVGSVFMFIPLIAGFLNVFDYCLFGFCTFQSTEWYQGACEQSTVSQHEDCPVLTLHSFHWQEIRKIATICNCSHIETFVFSEGMV